MKRERSWENVERAPWIALNAMVDPKNCKTPARF